MVFSSLEFLLYFLPITLLVYYLVPPVARNPVLLFFSIVFYGWGEPVYVLLMVATILADWLFGYLCGITRENKKRSRFWLCAACVFNIGLLVFFKYYGFISGNLNSLFGTVLLPELGVSLPIGISFYTFQAMSYVIDVYRGDTEYNRSPIEFGTYVSLFPQLIAGPIVRYKDVANQLKSRTIGVSRFAYGVRRFVCGLAKKALLADTAGEMWSYFSGLPDAERGTPAAWLGIVFFSFQIYFDFSGYSDMAIGLGRMLGFDFCENFNYPYISQSVTDFWRRWHISLSTWFRDYVYIPLGGNRVKLPRHIFNLLAVWLLTGLWHGASWSFVMWGVYYGVLLILEKYVWGAALAKAPAVLRHAYALLLVLGGWFIFASADVTSPAGYFSTLFGSAGAGQDAGYDALRSCVLLILLAVASTPYPARLRERFVSRGGRLARAVDLFGLAVLFILSVAFIVSSDYSPFLYTRF